MKHRYDKIKHKPDVWDQTLRRCTHPKLHSIALYFFNTRTGYEFSYRVHVVQIYEDNPTGHNAYKGELDRLEGCMLDLARQSGYV